MHGIVSPGVRVYWRTMHASFQLHKYTKYGCTNELAYIPKIRSPQMK